MDPSLLQTIIGQLNSLDVDQLRTLDKGINGLISQKEYQASASSGTPLVPVIPKLRVPNELLVPYTEFLFLSFLRELFKPENFPDHYQISDPDQLTNNDGVIVYSAYDETHSKRGQFPCVIVEATNVQTGPAYIGNRSEEGVYMLGDQRISANAALVTIGVSITVESRNRNDANVLANLIQFSIIATHDIMRHFMGFKAIGFPISRGAQLIREGGPIFRSDISFNCEKLCKWNSVAQQSIHKQLIWRLIARVTGEDNPPLVQMISSIQGKVDPTVERYLKMLAKAV